MPLLYPSAVFLTGIWLGSISAVPKSLLLSVFILCSLLALLEKRLMAWHFHQISVSAILANPLTLPAQPLVMTLGAVAMLGG